MKTALFPGSFDPFTIGHYDIVVRSLALFDNVVIGIGINSNKKYMFDLETRIANIKNVFADEPRVSVEKYDGLTMDFARQCGACCIVRVVGAMTTPWLTERHGYDPTYRERKRLFPSY